MKLENTAADTQLGRAASAQSQRPDGLYGPRGAESSQSVDTFTPVVPRKHRRSASRASLLNDSPEEVPPPVPPKSAASRQQRSAPRKKPPRIRDDDKENSDVSPNPSPALARSKTALLSGTSAAGPTTPTRARSVLDARYLADGPSPASSSELSPVAKDMMANLRKQRLQIQNVARRSGRGLRSAS
ncbi:uncharacterized protein C8Q71DRAFT_702338 [Rhodofomes roseus]|uniref:Uncharacterized protein n=1 Tax=Rhodofomes roseus TaxID=34475 RepID=A0ABQ8KNN4_9APHY|nr:uncharacterized protein C8Q71DRAFT_702338 [Rhodofomes roseus]KAH9839773.1 hypothetical protein C8Q71DRAFT_702338 [Rhodofomes roseus]